MAEVASLAVILWGRAARILLVSTFLGGFHGVEQLITRQHTQSAHRRLLNEVLVTWWVARSNGLYTLILCQASASDGAR